MIAISIQGLHNSHAYNLLDSNQQNRCICTKMLSACYTYCQEVDIHQIIIFFIPGLSRLLGWLVWVFIFFLHAALFVVLSSFNPTSVISLLHASFHLRFGCTLLLLHASMFLRQASLDGTIKMTSRVPVEGKSSVCLICMKYRIIFLINIIISLGQILLSCIANTSSMRVRTHTRAHAPTQTSAHTTPHTRRRRRIAIRWVCASQP